MNINIPNKKLVKENVESFRSFLATRFDQATDKRNDKATRYEKSYKLYNSLLPLKETDRRVSMYVSPVVRTVVDKVLPGQLNIFTENEAQAVVFRPQKTMLPADIIKAVNTHINTLFLRENDGYNVLSNAFREALISGDAFVKVFIEEEEVVEEVDLTDTPIPMEAFTMMLEHYPDTDVAKLDIREEVVFDEATQMEVPTQVVSGVVELKRIEKHYRTTFVPFDEMFVLGDTQNVADTRYLCHRMTKTVGELVEMGFDREKVMTGSDTDETQDLSVREFTNTKVIGGSDDVHKAFIDPMEREVYLYEHYIWSSLFDKKGKSKLYQVFAVNKSCILEVNEVARIPFVHGVAANIPGAFWGEGMGDRFGEAQNLISGIIRDIADKSALAVFPRYYAVKGQYDKQALLNNRPGGVIEMNEPGMVGYFPETPMPSEAMTVLQQLQNDVADATLNNVGVNLDPSTLQNVSATAVASAVSKSEMKDKVIAKTFAQTLVRPLFELLYHTLRDNGDTIMVETFAPPAIPPKMAEAMAAQGQNPNQPVEQLIPFDCSQLPSRSEFYIDVNTSNDDAIQAATLQGVATFLGQMSQVPNPVAGPQQLYNIAKAILKSADIIDTDAYLMDPSKAPQPDPQMVAMEQQNALELQQLQKDQAKAAIGAQMALQVKAEAETLELVADGKHKRQLDQAKMLLEYEVLEFKKSVGDAKAEYDVERNAIRRDELEAEVEAGRPIGITQ